MSDFTPQLEAAITQSDLTPAQQAQLLTVISGDPQLLDRLNEDAVNHNLGHFALAAPDSKNLVGTYDGSIVTLPADSFGAGSAHLDATLRVQSMTMQFSRATEPDTGRRVPFEAVNNLQNVLNGSPVLADEIRRAVTGNPAPLKSFQLLKPETSAGGEYHSEDQAMHLPLTSLTRSGAGANFSERDLTFVLGHEIQHSLNAAKVAHEYTQFYDQVTSIASGPRPHDYTEPIRKMLNHNRDDEDSAQIAGWNALVSREQQTNPNVSLDDMWKISESRDNPTWRVRDFVQLDKATGRAQARDGFSFNDDATLTPDRLNDKRQTNIEVEGRYYFDKPANQTGIGHNGDSDYANYYGAYLIGRVIDIERQHVQPGPPGLDGKPGEYPPITVDLHALKLSERLMERDGINITPIPGHTDVPHQPYIDSGEQLPRPPRYFDYTAKDGGYKYVPVRPEMTSGPGLRTAAPDAQGQPNEPQSTQYEQQQRYAPQHEQPGQQAQRPQLNPYQPQQPGEQHGQPSAVWNERPTALPSLGAASTLRLDPDLQRIYDAALTGNPAQIDEAMKQSAQAYRATPQGQAFMMETQAGAQALIKQHEQEIARQQERATYFPAQHRDRALFDAIREHLPEGTPDRVTANVLLEAKQNGIRKPGDIEQVHVDTVRGSVWLGNLASTSESDLLQKPPLAQTLQQLDTVNQQQDAQRQQREQQRAQEQSTGMSR